MTDPRPVPYPADTRAKGWRFEVAYEQVEQSDTWSLAAEVPMCQHALLMMWFVAWTQVPCGSLPNDDALIRAKCKVPSKLWPSMRDVLLRGWWAADDGRLYHDTIVVRVQEMMRKRRSDSDRQAANRAKTLAESQTNHAGVTRDTNVTPAGVGSESSTDNRPPNTEDLPVGKSLPTKTPRKRRSAGGADAPCVSVEALVAEGVQRQHAEEWLEIRRQKNLPLTRTAWAATKDEALIVGLTPPMAVKESVVRGWAGFRAKWIQAEQAEVRGQNPSLQAARADAVAADAARLLGFGSQAATQPLETLERV